MSRMFPACGVLLAAVIAAAPLHARADPPSRRVAYGDLNLETDAGAKDLLRRIAFASRAVCRESTAGDIDVFTVLVYRACVDGVIRTSVAQVGSERLMRLYERGPWVMRTASNPLPGGPRLVVSRTSAP